MKQKLTEVRQWAKDKLATGSEPPWAWYQYMKLVETVDAILTGMESTKLHIVKDKEDDGKVNLPV